jgi:hypothetical protein
MRVAFFLVIERDPRPFLYATALVEQLVRTMPGVPIIQLSDTRTDRVPGVEEVWRIATTGPILEQRLRHYAALPAGDWLLLDTDIVIRADVRAVFEDATWDLALCDRNWAHAPQTVSILQRMPFNAGVVFSRSQAFWYDVRAAWASLPPEAQSGWEGEQLAIYEVVRSGKFRIKILPGQQYNFPPTEGKPIPEDAAILHYKGARKAQLAAVAAAIVSGQPGQEWVCLKS